MYRDIMGMLAKIIDAELSKATAIYNFDHGDEFEVAMCHVLRSALPARYGVCRGHIVTIMDEHAGDDIIIFDRDASPTLRFLPVDDYSRKEHIPFDAVYAYLEAKHTLWFDQSHKNGQSLAKALSQIASVRKLERADRRHNEILPGLTLSEGLMKILPGGLLNPDRSNPLLCGIISRNVGWDGKIRDADEFPDWSELSLGEKPHWPDLIVAGANFVGVPMANSVAGTTALRIFVDSKVQKLQFFYAHGRAMAVGLLCLLHAIDNIALKHIDWAPVILEQLNRKN